MPLFASLALLYKSLNESTLNTLLGPEAIWLSSELSTFLPMPKTNTAAPFLWRREDAISRGVYTPWAVVCFPVVITRTGYQARKRDKNKTKSIQYQYNILRNSDVEVRENSHAIMTSLLIHHTSSTSPIILSL